MECKNIAKKLVKIMGECSHIIKTGTNDYHHYKYATAEDVLKKINASLATNKIASMAIPHLESMVEVTTAKGNTEHLATVTIQIHLIDSDSGESVDLYGIGSGQDAGDKAVMKAQTAAIKYAYLLSMCIATGDDPEADIATDENMANTTKPEVKPAISKAGCESCGVKISDKVKVFSVQRYGKALCMDCQKEYAKVA